MSDAVNKSLDDVIKERKKSSGADKKKTGKNLTARKGTGRRTGKGQQGKNAGDKVIYLIQICFYAHLP